MNTNLITIYIFNRKPLFQVLESYDFWHYVHQLTIYYRFCIISVIWPPFVYTSQKQSLFHRVKAIIMYNVQDLFCSNLTWPIVHNCQVQLPIFFYFDYMLQKKKMQYLVFIFPNHLWIFIMNCVCLHAGCFHNLKYLNFAWNWWILVICLY